MKKYIITEKELKELLEDSWYLTDLQNAGLDNWEGMEYIELNEEELSTENYIEVNYKEYTGEE